MAQSTSVNAGIVAGPSHSDNLYLKVFSGETMKVFNTRTVLKGRHRERTISSGKSAQFAAIGRAAAEYHTPGNVILGQDINHGEKVISIDDMLISSTFVSNFEEAMNHYETRSEYAFQMGESLAQAYDQHLFAIALKAAKAGTAGAVAEMGVATEDKIGAAPSLTNVVDSIYAAATYFDATNIPANERTVFVTPSLYWDLIQDGSFINRDFGNGGANQNSGGQLKVATFDVVPTNNLAKNFGVNTLVGKRAGADVTDYTVDGTKALALVMQKQALGTVKLMNLSTEKEYQTSRQGTLMVSRMAVGHGVLRPECIRLISALA
ncbi:capsid protein [Mesorhizobium sp. L2C067A000]|uniref:capsid protein n=1 Tax=Mesorhizobium sp. L2C067A000 TaxID=1287106 RepID=UPI0003D0612D|nr:capsid protein [Mesorhizobium sp. L2C067A000]ESZ33218.1 capsid protein [Mesorhizobium sp. L2C067A000]